MDYHDLGQAIRDLRKAQRVTQKTIADHIGISRATLNALENGRAGDVGVRKVMKILDYLGHQLTIRVKSPFPTLEELRGE